MQSGQVNTDLQAFIAMVDSLALAERDQVILKNPENLTLEDKKDAKKLAIFALGKLIFALKKGLKEKNITLDNAKINLSTFITMVIDIARNKSLLGSSKTADILNKFRVDHKLPALPFSKDHWLSVIQIGNQYLVEALLHFQPSLIDTVDESTWKTGLMTAVEHNHLAIVQVLLEQKAENVFHRKKYHETVFDYAVKYDRATILDLLLRKTKTLRSNNPKKLDEKDWFDNAVKLGHIKSLSVLIENIGNDNVHSANRVNLTPLHLAVLNKRKNVVQYLMEMQNVDINKSDGIGRTALYFALEGKDRKIIDLLTNHPLMDLKAFLSFSSLNFENFFKSESGMLFFEYILLFSEEKLKNLLVQIKNHQKNTFLAKDFIEGWDLFLNSSTVLQPNAIANKNRLMNIMPEYFNLDEFHQFQNCMTPLIDGPVGKWRGEEKDIYTVGVYSGSWTTVEDNALMKGLDGFPISSNRPKFMAIQKLGMTIRDSKSKILKKQSTVTEEINNVLGVIQAAIDASREKSNVGRSEIADQLQKFKDDLSLQYPLSKKDLSTDDMIAVIFSGKPEQYFKQLVESKLFIQYVSNLPETIIPLESSTGLFFRIIESDHGASLALTLRKTWQSILKDSASSLTEGQIRFNDELNSYFDALYLFRDMLAPLTSPDQNILKDKWRDVLLSGLEGKALPALSLPKHTAIHHLGQYIAEASQYLLKGKTDIAYKIAEVMQRISHAADQIKMEGKTKSALYNFYYELRREYRVCLNLRRDARYPVPELMGAIGDKSLNEVKALFIENPDRLMNNALDNGILHYAAFVGDQAIVAFLLKQENIDALNQKNADGIKPLHLAIENHHEEVAALLIKKFSVDANDIEMLHLAASHGQVKVVTLLLEAFKILGIDGVTAKDKRGRTPLYYAAVAGQEAVVTLLLSLDPNAALNQTDNQGQTLLHVAVEDGNERGVRFLLRQGIDSVDAVNNQGKTPLYLAISKGYQSTVDLLLANHATIPASLFDQTTEFSLSFFYHLVKNRNLVQSISQCSIEETTNFLLKIKKLNSLLIAQLLMKTWILFFEGLAPASRTDNIIQFNQQIELYFGDLYRFKESIKPLIKNTKSPATGKEYLFSDWNAILLRGMTETSLILTKVEDEKAVAIYNLGKNISSLKKSLLSGEINLEFALIEIKKSLDHAIQKSKDKTLVGNGDTADGLSSYLKELTDQYPLILGELRISDNKSTTFGGVVAQQLDQKTLEKQKEVANLLMEL